MRMLFPAGSLFIIRAFHANRFTVKRDGKAKNAERQTQRDPIRLYHS